MNSNWRKNREKAIYRDTEPSLTDQAGANDTDINVIVRNFNIHGQLPQGRAEPTYGDFSELPSDFREVIELTRSLGEHRRKLPGRLADMPVDQLLSLTPDKLREIIAADQKPADKPADTPQEPAK